MNIKSDFKIWLYLLTIGVAVYLLNLIVPLVQGLSAVQSDNVQGASTMTNTVEVTQAVTPAVSIEATLSLPTPTIGLLQPPLTVQLVGDSMMLEGFGPRLNAKLLTFKGITVKRAGRYSTGLNRTDYYNWYAQTQNLLNVNKPAVLIVMFGANDGQGIIPEGAHSKVSLGSPQWDGIYAQRVNKYLTQFAPQVKEFYWIGQPIAGNSDFYNKFARMNPIYASECAKFPNCHYVDAWSRFAVNGKYVPTLADDNGLVQTVKGGDGVHLTNHGGNILADLVIKTMKQDIVL